MPKKKTKKQMGRPSKYKPDYCAGLVEHMAEGLSFESYGGVVSVDRSTLYYWVAQYKDFSDAKREGELKSQLFWEKILRDSALGAKDYNATAIIYTMKCRFGGDWLQGKEDRVKVD